MQLSQIRYGLCVIILAAFSAVGASACGEAGPTVDEQTDSADETGAADETADENVAEVSQAVSCGWGGPPAHCMGRCCDPYKWYDLGNPGWGNCHETVNAFCANKYGNCGECWGYP